MQAEEGCERSVITYSALIGSCEKAGRWQLALNLFGQMERDGIAPNTAIFNAAMSACAQGELPFNSQNYGKRCGLRRVSCHVCLRTG